MPTTEYLCHLAEISSCNLSKEEKLYLEAELFTRLCEELREIFRIQNKDYFHLLKITREMENNMLDANLIRWVINDILSTGEYTIQGIAHYSSSYEDVIYDIVCGCIIAPSLPLSRKIIELHRTVRPSLYSEIIKKLMFKE